MPEAFCIVRAPDECERPGAVTRKPVTARKDGQSQGRRHQNGAADAIGQGRMVLTEVLTKVITFNRTERMHTAYADRRL